MAQPARAEMENVDANGHASVWVEASGKSDARLANAKFGNNCIVHVKASGATSQILAMESEPQITFHRTSNSYLSSFANGTQACPSSLMDSWIENAKTMGKELEATISKQMQEAITNKEEAKPEQKEVEEATTEVKEEMQEDGQDDDDGFVLYAPRTTMPVATLAFDLPRGNPKHPVDGVELGKIIESMIDDPKYDCKTALAITGLLPSIVAACGFDFKDMGIAYVTGMDDIASGPTPLYLWRRDAHVCHIEKGQHHSAQVVLFVNHLDSQFVLLFTREQDDDDDSAAVLDHARSKWHGSIVDACQEDGYIDYTAIATRGLKKQTSIDIDSKLLRSGCYSRSRVRELFLNATDHMKTYYVYIDSDDTKIDRSGLVKQLFQNITQRDIETMNPKKKLFSAAGAPIRNKSTRVHAFRLPNDFGENDFNVSHWYDLFQTWQKCFGSEANVSKIATLVAFALKHQNERFRIDMNECKPGPGHEMEIRQTFDGLDYLERIPRDRVYYLNTVTSTTLHAKIDDRMQKLCCQEFEEPRKRDVVLPQGHDNLVSIPFLARLMLPHRTYQDDENDVVMREIVMDHAESLFQPQPNQEDYRRNIERAQAKDIFGNNALHYAAAHGLPAKFKAHFNLCERNAFGQTPAHIAVQFCPEYVLDFLPENGTVPLIETDYGSLGIFDYSLMMGMPLPLTKDTWQVHSAFSQNPQSLLLLLPAYCAAPSFLQC